MGRAAAVAGPGVTRGELSRAGVGVLHVRSLGPERGDALATPGQCHTGALGGSSLDRGRPWAGARVTGIPESGGGGGAGK